MKTAGLALILGSSLHLLGQTPSDPPEKPAIEAQDRAYEAAYAKADVKALTDFFTDDAEYTSDDGQMFAGRPEIEATLRQAFAAKKGATLAIDLMSVQRLAPEVLLEKGATTVTSKEGATNRALYTAVYVNKGGQWKIRQLVETPAPVLTPGDHLSELAWLAGSWEEADKTAGLTVRSKYEWSRGGNFLTRNVTVKRGEDTLLEGWQIIGWDANEGRIRSWTFDTEGGFSEGRWTREGQRWLVRETGVTPDGSCTTADNTFTRLGPDSLAWESANRTSDGDPLPGIGQIQIHRTKGD